MALVVAKVIACVRGASSLARRHLSLYLERNLRQLVLNVRHFLVNLVLALVEVQRDVLEKLDVEENADLLQFL